MQVTTSHACTAVYCSRHAHAAVFTYHLVNYTTEFLCMYHACYMHKSGENMH